MKDKTITKQVPKSIHSKVSRDIEDGNFPEWFYPRSVDESLTEYIETRRGNYDQVSFALYPNDRCTPYNINKPNRPPKPIHEILINMHRPVYQESYKLRIYFESKRWENVKNMELIGYFVYDPDTI